MHEYMTEAVVLDREPVNELDFRISFFTKRRGKLVAKAKSARKILSKLSGHLMPGNVAQIRVVERGGMQVVDALKLGVATPSIPDLRMLNVCLADADVDHHLWHGLTEGAFDWRETLKLLGWDPGHAACATCSRHAPEAFHPRSQEFFCRPCASKLDQKTLLYWNGQSVGNQA